MGVSKTAAEAFGPEIADELARWAIDALCMVPVSITTATTRLSARHVREGREILDRAGVDWPALTKAHFASRRAS